VLSTVSETKSHFRADYSSSFHCQYLRNAGIKPYSLAPGQTTAAPKVQSSFKVNPGLQFAILLRFVLTAHAIALTFMYIGICNKNIKSSPQCHTCISLPWRHRTIIELDHSTASLPTAPVPERASSVRRQHTLAVHSCAMRILIRYHSALLGCTLKR
jgi:hypothetical protein